jgi:hypothetical protein
MMAVPYIYCHMAMYRPLQVAEFEKQWRILDE